MEIRLKVILDSICVPVNIKWILVVDRGGGQVKVVIRVVIVRVKNIGRAGGADLIYPSFWNTNNNTVG